MRTQLKSLLTLILASFALVTVEAFPEYRSLAGLSPEEVERVARTFQRTPGAQPPPPPPLDTSSRLVNDAAHPWKPLRKNDIRGVCPGLNTLASHGYMDRSGVVTPGELINAVQEGYNMKNDLAIFFTYAAFLVDGNHLTNLMSLGQKTENTGTDAPAPAIIGGLNTHGTFEGDASFTRGDKYFGDNFSYNETLFQQLVKTANEVGNGTLNIASLAQQRYNRIQDSIARNPTFDITSPRFISAYGETALPVRFWKNVTTDTLTVEDARSFYQKSRMPENFHRREGAFGNADLYKDILEIWGLHKTLPGGNVGRAGNFVADPNDPGTGSTAFCYFYTKIVNVTLRRLYPNPQGDLRTAIRGNIKTFYLALGDPSCPELHIFD